MLLKRIITCLVLLNLIALIVSGPMQLWSYEYLEVYNYSSDRSKFDIDGKIVRISRGKYGLSAIVELKIDLYDDALFSVTIERSLSRKGPYTKLPMVIGNYSLSMAANMFYKTVIQPTLLQCCKNAPIINGTFKPPLAKLRMVCKDCYLKTDNLPNILMEGYYRFRLTMYGPFYAYVGSLCYVQTKVL